MQRILLTIGLLFVVLGLLWPIISKLGLGRLPGDIAIERGDFKLYFPFTSSILISLFIALVIWLIRK